MYAVVLIGGAVVFEFLAVGREGEGRGIAVGLGLLGGGGGAELAGSR